MRREIIYQTVIQDSSGKIIFQYQEDSKHAYQQLRILKRGFYRLIRYTPNAILMQTIHKKQ